MKDLVDGCATGEWSNIFFFDASKEGRLVVEQHGQGGCPLVLHKSLTIYPELLLEKKEERAVMAVCGFCFD